MSYDGNEGAAYAGHHPVHTGLQRHSVSEVYPLAVVGYGEGSHVLYRVENLMTGACVHAAGHSWKPFETPSAASAAQVLDRVHRSGKLYGVVDLDTYWAFAPRPFDVPNSGTRSTYGTRTGRTESMTAAQAATYKPVHGGYPGDVPPRAFNSAGSGPLETR